MSQEQKHTGGEWMAVQYPDESWGVRVKAPIGFAVAIIVAQDICDRDNGEEAANAALIAQAPLLPELLEICKLVMGEIEEDSDLETVDFGPAAHRLKDFLAKYKP